MNLFSGIMGVVKLLEYISLNHVGSSSDTIKFFVFVIKKPTSITLLYRHGKQLLLISLIHIDILWAVD
uniref:Uncharacterized protein n=1 Tax=Arion vulgaris TaxID=1028688 RepID=A0A0B6ZUQ4_9EUPU